MVSPTGVKLLRDGIVLLDENFPLAWLRSLHNDGLSAQHIITLGWRLRLESNPPSVRALAKR